MLNLQRTAMFIAVAETGSFTAAAEAMGLTKAVVSFHMLSRASMPFIPMPGMCPRKCEHLLILCASG